MQMSSDLSPFRKTKIVCTIGPASSSDRMIEKLAMAGMNIARLNFSHGTHEQHAAHVKAIRRVASRLDLPLAILQDLPGPKLRTGRLKEDKVWLKKNDDFTLTTRDIAGNQHMVSVSLASLPSDVSPGDAIFLNDGAIKLEVLSTSDCDVRCKVIVGGLLTAEKGLNIPGVKLSTAPVTSKDLNHLAFGLEQGVDFVALSFIHEADDVLKVRQFLQARGANIPLIAKIEKFEATENIDEIIAVVDGVMVARGDLGVEMPLEKVPLVQKEIISKCNLAGKPVIVATQMLESMVHSPYPTRAEVSDIANAIFDGTDAIMLSGETAVGEYPEEATLTMAKVAIETETDLPYHRILAQKMETLIPQTADAISYAACHIAEQLEVAGIIAHTSSGSTAQRVAKYRPRAPILAVTPEDSVRRKLALYWGIYSCKISEYARLEEVFRQGAQLAVKLGMARRGDLLVITAGLPLEMPGSTNILKVQQIE